MQQTTPCNAFRQSACTTPCSTVDEQASETEAGQAANSSRSFAASKKNPARRSPRIPMLKQHLREIRGQLQRHTNRYHKALWALWLKQWQGVLRSSDLIKHKREAKRPGVPSQETHRGRISVEVAGDLSGRSLRPRINILLKPNKTDQAGVKQTTKTFVVEETPEALSAGQAIREMLRADPDDAGLNMKPLFRHPVTGSEITYEKSHAALQKCLQAAGYYAKAIGTHWLCIGRATAFANTRNGGYAVSGFMGLHPSDSKEWYMYACKPRIDMAALEIGRATTWEIAGRPGPVARYAN